MFREPGESSKRQTHTYTQTGMLLCRREGLARVSSASCAFFSASAFFCSLLSLRPPFPLHSTKMSVYGSGAAKRSRAHGPLNARSASLVPSSNFGKQHLPVPEGRLDPGSGMLQRCSPLSHHYSVSIAAIDVLSHYVLVCHRFLGGRGYIKCKVNLKSPPWWDQCDF